jgi:hypothetical protein
MPLIACKHEARPALEESGAKSLSFLASSGVFLPTSSVNQRGLTAELQPQSEL